MEPTQVKNPLTLPMAIVVAGGLIAGALFLRGGGDGASRVEPIKPVATIPSPELGALKIRPIDATRDYIRGNPDANIIFVEFSDSECPFCKRFHTTMQQIMNEYGKSGQVAWVYREYPIVGLHPKAPKESEAILCAGELGGNAKFWEYLDHIFEITPSNNGLDPAELPLTATTVGLNESRFNECLSSGRQGARVQEDLSDGTTAGVNGTPHSVLVLKGPISATAKKTLLALMEQFRDPQGELPIGFSLDGLRVSLNGALPYPIVKSTIDTLLK